MVGPGPSTDWPAPWWPRGLERRGPRLTWRWMLVQVGQPSITFFFNIHALFRGDVKIPFL